MRLVPRPFLAPMRCAAIPHLGQTSPGRWVDTGSEMPGFDNHVYLHETSVIEAARLLGYPSRSDHWQACQDRDRAQARVAELEAELEATRATLSAVYTLRNSGFVQGAKPGRPRKETAA